MIRIYCDEPEKKIHLLPKVFSRPTAQFFLPDTEPMKGFEPLTPSLPWKCSTPELHWHAVSIYSVYAGPHDWVHKQEPQKPRKYNNAKP